MKIMLDLTQKDVDLILRALDGELEILYKNKDDALYEQYSKIADQFLDLYKNDLPFYMLKMDFDSWINAEDLDL